MSVNNLPGLCTAVMIFWQGLAVSLAKTFWNGAPMRLIATDVGSKPVKSLPSLMTFGRRGRRTVVALVGDACVVPPRASPIA